MQVVIQHGVPVDREAAAGLAVIAIHAKRKQLQPTGRQHYLALAVAGLLLPYSQFVPWLLTHGFDPAHFVDDLFSNQIGGFFAMDVLVSAVVLFAFIAHNSMQLPGSAEDEGRAYGERPRKS